MKRVVIFRLATPLLATVVTVAILWPVADYVLLLGEHRRSRQNERLLREAKNAEPTDWVKPTRGLLRLVIPAEDQRQGYRMRPGVKGYVGYASVRVNSNGHRDRRYPAAKPDGTYRTVVLGDSHTFGNGVSPASETYPKVLEAMHNRVGLSQTHEVLSFGVPGYNTRAEEATLELEAMAYDPDAIVLQFCPNDLDPPHIYRRPRDAASGSRVLDSAGRLWKLALTPRTGNDYHLTSDMPEFYHRQVGWPVFRESVANIRRLAGRRPCFFLVDYGEFVLGPEKPGAMNRQAADITHTAGFTVVDPWDEYVSFLRSRGLADSQALDVSRTDPHPNRRRHELIARCLLQAMARVLPPNDAEQIALTYFGDQRRLTSTGPLP